MAEFMHKAPAEAPAGMAAMGQPISFERKQAGYDACKLMNLDGSAAWRAVNAMAEALEHDRPYDAMQAGMQCLDLTGTYRLMATLLTEGR